MITVLAYMGVIAGILALWTGIGILAYASRGCHLPKRVSEIMWTITECSLLAVLLIKLCYGWEHIIAQSISISLLVVCLLLMFINVFYQPVESK